MGHNKNLFFIVIGVVVLAAVGFYIFMVPDVASQASAAMTDCTNTAVNIQRMAMKASQPDGLITQEHVKLAKSYKTQVSEQVKELKDVQAGRMKLDLRFKTINKEPPQGMGFDIWLEELRNGLLKRAADAGLSLDKIETDKLLFKEHTDYAPAAEPAKQRDYRIRHMAITEEVLTILARKTARAECKVFDPQSDKNAAMDVGALALEKLVIGSRRSSADRSPCVEEALKRAARTAGAASPAPAAAAKGTPAPAFAALPVAITPVELQIVAPLPALPHILRALECSDRYFAVIGKLEMQRAESVFAPGNDERLKAAGPNPSVNTYYMEGPVRVVIGLELYEADPSKDAEFSKVLAGK